MSQLQDAGRQIIRNNERVADTIYQRKIEGADMVPPTMKGLIAFTELLVTSGKADSEHMEQMKIWQEDFARLADANEKNDLILVADILHHDLNPQITEWIN